MFEKNPEKTERESNRDSRAHLLGLETSAAEEEEEPRVSLLAAPPPNDAGVEGLPAKWEMARKKVAKR